MIKVTRTIYPVGQGAFYTESFDCDGDRFNVVYDCGSLGACTQRKLEPQRGSHPLKVAIDDYLKSVNSQVDVLFISHFHEDHINGVKYLLDKIGDNKIQIFVPKVNDDMKRYYFLRNFVRIYGLFDEKHVGKNEIAEAKNDFLEWLPSFLFFQNTDNNGGDNSNREYNEIPRDQSSSPLSFPIFNDLWEYIPIWYLADSLNVFVGRVMSALYKEVEDFRNATGNLFNLTKQNWQSISTVLKQFEKERKKIKENNLSLMLYSGPKNYANCSVQRPTLENPVLSFQNQTTLFEFKDFDKKPSAIYVGDMELSEAYGKIVENLGTKKDTVGLVQLSHHGDENPFNDELVQINPLLSFCCFGTKNRYHHPGWVTIAHFLNNEVLVCPIDEKSEEMTTIVELS